MSEVSAWPLVFDTSEETRVVSTTVLARAESAGLWLAMPNARFARDVKERGLLPGRGRCVGADRFVRLRREGGADHLVNLVDVSLAGARIGGGVPASLARGERIEVRLASTEVGEPTEVGGARVVWTEGGEAGHEFDRREAACRAALAKPGRCLPISKTPADVNRARDEDRIMRCVGDRSERNPAPLERCTD